jgi:hypothetical protein
VLGRGFGPQFPDVSRRIVGVVGDIRDEALSREPRPIASVRVFQLSDGITAWNTRLRPYYWFVRTTAPPHRLTPAIQARLREVSKGLPINLVRTVDEVLSRSRRLVLRQGLRLAFVGVLFGSAAALGLARLLTGLLFGVRPWDPVVFATVPVVIILIAAAAVWIPALRAARLQPVLAIRSE